MMDFETQKSANKLLNGEATQEDRDKVLYFLASTRWTPERLDGHIREVHDELCKTCPLKLGIQQLPMQKIALNWNEIIKTVLWVIGGLVAIIATLTKTSLQ